jgi:hypothetical protein
MAKTHEPEAPARNRYQVAEDRDAALEERYQKWCDPRICCRSLLASVSVHGAAMLAEYMAWCQEHRVSDACDYEQLALWETERFGRKPYPAAHGHLAFLVHTAVYGDPYKKRPAPKPAPAEEPGREMPGEPLGFDDGEWNRRINALRTQAAAADARLPYPREREEGA